MKKLLAILLLSTTIFAQNPKLFAPLGDVMYNSVDKVEKLQDISVFFTNRAFIDLYIKQLEKTKLFGQTLNNTSIESHKKRYLKELRRLSSDYDNILRSVNAQLTIAMEASNVATFIDILDTGLVLIDASRRDLIHFYESNVQQTQKVACIEAYLESTRKPDVRKLTPHEKALSKIERVEAKEREEERRKRAEYEAIEAEKLRKLKEEQRKALD